MPYDIPGFSFNPSKSTSFNPTKKNIGDSGTPVPTSQNLYLPTCNSSDLLRQTYRNQVNEIARNYGMAITYIPRKYDFNVANFIYGEDRISGYINGRELKAIIDFQSYTTFLTKFGIMSDADLTIYIPLEEFERVWGPRSGEGGIYPLAGDLFFINDSACDRPLQQSPMVFEVIDKDDKVNPVDYMGGHYLWKINAKRFDYSYEKGAPEERFLDNSSDTKQFGRLADSENGPDLSSREYDVDDFQKEEFELPADKQNVYGGYL